MKKIIIFLTVVIISLTLMCMTSQKDNLSVFISVDMEGIAGVTSGIECSSRGPDYDYFRKIMTMETNAAIEAALESGASEIVVRDGHGSKTNIIPGLLHRKAKLVRGVTDRPENMMLGINDTFDAVMFIGYHAKAGTKEGVLAHTSSGNVIDLSVNGVSLPEGGYNALLAGLHDVPTVFVAGDNWICEQMGDLLGEVVTCETKTGMGTAEIGLHPDEVGERIKKGVSDALSDLSRFNPYKLTPPYTMVLKVKKEKEPYTGAKKIGEGEFEFTSSDFLEVMDAFNKMK
jgi:D-amino peptidase